ncbi:hypothetical protein [Fulvimarina sp. MAC3]|uniref:hypothetical protein n=1 Tax=Fulvimarina sp. MAC3 TaxID=3148887 RepID=UPI0031FDE635
MSETMLEERLTIDDLARRMERASNRSKPLVTVYQNVYADSVIKALDPAFVPVDGRSNANTEFRENGLFIRMFISGLYQSAEYTGIVSPKFNEKAMISGEAFLEFVESNPGYDVYFVNPFPHNIYYTFNVWDHAEICHPGITALADILFDEAGYDFRSVCDKRNDAKTALYSNFWVGNEPFWEGYMVFIMNIIDALERLPSGTRRLFFERDPDYPDPVPILPFILERCPSTFFSMFPEVRTKAYNFTREEIFQHLPRNEEALIVPAFADWVDNVDAVGLYEPNTREVFRAIAHLRKMVAESGSTWRGG